MSDPPLTYIDSNILIAYVLGPKKEPRQFPLAEQFFRSIAGNKYRGMLSYLACSEILEVFRSIKAREYSHLLTLASDDDRTGYVIDGANDLYAAVIGEIVRIPEIRMMPPLQVDASAVLGSAVEILTRVRGSVRSHNRCGKCGSSQQSDFFSGHKCVGTADVIHALLAKALKCDLLATFDKAFREIENDPALKGLRIWVLE